MLLASSSVDPRRGAERDTTLKGDGFMRKEARRVMVGQERVIRDVLRRVRELIGREGWRKWGGK